MANQLKIMTMTRLALYDKHEGPQDRAANDYFRHDFIYRNNLGTRIAVGLGGIIILLIYWLQAFLLNEMDIFQFNYQQYVAESIFFILALLAVYSLIGTIQGTRQYYLVQKRLAQYQALVRQLERLEERTHRVYDEEYQPQNQHDVEFQTRRHDSGPPVRTQPEHTRQPARTRPPSRPPSEYTEHYSMQAKRTRPPEPPPVEYARPRQAPSSEYIKRPLPSRPPEALSHDYTRAPRPRPSHPHHNIEDAQGIDHTRIPVRPRPPRESD